MKITGDEMLSKTLSKNETRLIKKSIASGYIVSKENAKEVLLTKIIRRIQQGKITVDKQKEQLFENVPESLDQENNSNNETNYEK